MTLKELRSHFKGQFGAFRNLKFIEIDGTGPPKVGVVSHWKLADLCMTHTYDILDQEFTLPRLRIIKIK